MERSSTTKHRLLLLYLLFTKLIAHFRTSRKYNAPVMLLRYVAEANLVYGFGGEKKLHGESQPLNLKRLDTKNQFFLFIEQCTLSTMRLSLTHTHARTHIHDLPPSNAIDVLVEERGFWRKKPSLSICLGISASRRRWACLHLGPGVTKKVSMACSMQEKRLAGIYRILNACRHERLTLGHRRLSHRDGKMGLGESGDGARGMKPALLVGRDFGHGHRRHRGVSRRT